MALSQNVKITYKLSMPDPANHILKVELNYSGIKENFIDFKLPVWRPGRYMILDFSSGVISFKAISPDSKELSWKKIDKSTWQVKTKSLNEVKIEYEVYANEFELRTRGLDKEHAFIDGTSVFMYTDKYKNHPLTLKVEQYKDWHVTTGLENFKDNNFEFIAPNYDYFVDCPLEIGTQEDIEFNVEGKKHIVSIFGNPKINKDTLISDFTKIIKNEYGFWGYFPYEKYVFIIHCTPESGGGTEHINSSVNDIRPSVFENESSYKGFFRLIAHEFFHTWNVKQLRPKGLTPYDYSKENYTEELWIAEGSTSYYDGLIVLRAGMASVDDFYNEITRSVEGDRRRPGNKIQSLAESGFDAWVKFWKNTPGKYDVETDYYGKGANVSLLLDLEIRERTNNKFSLDDVFRAMIHKYPLSVGYTNLDFLNMCNTISGSNFKLFFEDYVFGVKPLDWENGLSYAGLELSSGDSVDIEKIGLITESKEGKIIVKEIDSNSYAYSSGLVAGDEIITFNRKRVDYQEYMAKMNAVDEGDIIHLSVFRNDQLKEITITNKPVKEFNYQLKQTANPTDLQKNIYESWLVVKWK